MPTETREETAGEFMTRLGDSGEKWADEFIKIVVAGGLTIDQDLMRAWFANAIENACATRLSRWQLEQAERERIRTTGIDYPTLRGVVARGWCHTKNIDKPMDTDIGNAIVAEVARWLGAPAEKETPRRRSESSFMLGDVVRLKSGGPAMVIERYSEATGYLCRWQNAQGLAQCELYPATDLIRASWQEVWRLHSEPEGFH